MAEHVNVFIDGAARNQGLDIPNEAAAACVIYYNRDVVAQFAQGLGNVSNNIAEYQALINALLICSTNGWPMPVVYCDSQTVVNHIKGVWKCWSPDLLPYYITVKEIQDAFPFNLIHVPRSKTFMADDLCNLMLDKISEHRKRTPIRVPRVKKQE